MKAAVIEGPGKIQLKDVPRPVPKKDEVVIKVAFCGICGTDYRIFNGEYISPYPLIPGHEFSGIIDEKGENVTDLEVGEKVCVDPSLYCGTCYFCRQNYENMCENWGAIGDTTNGAFAEYVAVPAKNVYRLPENVSLEEGALVEPLACVVYAMKRLKMEYGSRALLFGSGPMGLLLLQALKKGGASEVVVVDIEEKKLEYAKKMGANKIFTDVKEIKNYNPKGFDVVVDATGNPTVIETMFQFVGPKGKVLQFGCAPKDSKVSINPFDIYHKDIMYIGTMALQYTFNQAINFLKFGEINVRDIVTKIITLEEFVEYIKIKKPADDLKVLVKVN